MCGRYAATRNPARLAVEFDAVDGTDGAAPGPDYNVAPTKPVLAVVERHPREPGADHPDPERTVRSIRVMRWGLVPAWAKDPSIGTRMINARAETVAEKPAFRTPLQRRRCLLPADGWYEWKREGGQRLPFYMTPRDGAVLALAGIWTTWRSPELSDAPEDTAPLVTCAVLTTEAVGPLRDVHERMPLFLPREAWEDWLDPDRGEVGDLLVPPSRDLVDTLELRPVSRAVNNVRNNGPSLLAAVNPGGGGSASSDRSAPRLRAVPDGAQQSLFDL
ncbi:MAG TPA: SOS response-associated peptidase [Pseudonocardiaceae bacterium]